jgi:glutathione S-transferase
LEEVPELTQVAGQMWRTGMVLWMFQALARPLRHGLQQETSMTPTVLTISSKNYGAWALRGWLMAKLVKLDFEEHIISPDDPNMKAEMLLLSASMRVPALVHNGIHVWDTLAIGEYLHEIKPRAGLLPSDLAARTHCRAICGEMHSGFTALRSSLPMNIKGHFPGFKLWSRAQGDIDRIVSIWQDGLQTYGGPYLFGKKPCMADAMFAPVVTRFLTYDVVLDEVCQAYCQTIMALPAMQAWVAAAQTEPDEIDELDAEF